MFDDLVYNYSDSLGAFKTTTGPLPPQKENKGVILLLLDTNDFRKCHIFSMLCPNGCLCF